MANLLARSTRQMRVHTGDESRNQSESDVPLKPAPMMAIVGWAWQFPTYPI
jgi:hypothetical protein